MRKDHDGTGVPGAEPSSARPAPDGSAKFLTGDLMRHVAVMSLSASVGLVSVFLVDFVDLYFIALIGDPALTAAVGFAGALVFFNISATIGLMIAVGALAARRIGAGDTLGARRAATNVLALGVAIGAVLGVTLAVAATPLLAAMGAQGEALAAGTQYLQIVAPSLPIMVVGMAASGLLRAHGDARRAMTVTLTAGAVNAVLDPLFIFVLDLGLNGAALASVCARIAMALSALAPVYRHYGGLAPWNAAAFRADLPAILGIAGPAVLTNLATPAGAILVTRFMAAYGDDAVAGFAVISRLTPLVFCVIFALSGAVGPIVGQNYGACKMDRVRETIRKALLFSCGYVAIAWILTGFGAGTLADLFDIGGEGRALIWAFGIVCAPLYFFNGALFISNAAFNNLDRPIWSTGLNWARNTLGIVPFAILGAELGGASGVLIGQALGGVVFGIAGIVLALRLARRYEASLEAAALQPGQ